MRCLSLTSLLLAIALAFVLMCIQTTGVQGGLVPASGGGYPSGGGGYPSGGGGGYPSGGGSGYPSGGGGGYPSGGGGGYPSGGGRGNQPGGGGGCNIANPKAAQGGGTIFDDGDSSNIC